MINFIEKVVKYILWPNTVYRVYNYRLMYLHFHVFDEEIWNKECPEEFKPTYYRGYVDDVFALFNSPDQLEKSTNYLNSKHRNIKVWF